MAGLRLNSGVRVLQLCAGGSTHQHIADILASTQSIQYLGSFDVGQFPHERVRALDPHVVLIHLPIPSLQVLRWINYLRTALHNCAIVVIGPMGNPVYRQSGSAWGADGFVGEERLARGLLRSIQRAYRKHFHIPRAERMRLLHS